MSGPAAPAAQWETLYRAIAQQLPDLKVEVVAELDSTNSELMRRARVGRMDAVLLVAQRQTAGRGRLGRQWYSHPEAAGDATAPVAATKALAALTFSLGLPLAPRDWSGLSLVVGLALAETLSPLIQLKWPNDLWLEDRMLAGILLETASFGEGGAVRRYVVIGIGINLGPRAATGLSTAPAWLHEVRPGVDAAQVLVEIAAPLVQAVRLFETHGFAPFQARFNARDALRDRAVLLSDGTAGTAHGVSEAGALLVHTALGMQVVTSSEVSVRPAA